MEELVKKCARCGAEFRTWNPRRLYCKVTCKDAVKREKRKGREQYRKPFKICTATNWKLSAISVAAREAGMQYGEFVKTLTPDREAEIYREYKQRVGA